MPQTLESVLIGQANSHVGPFLDKVKELLDDYGLLHCLDNGPSVTEDGSICFQMSALPVLPFFIDLAALCEVPIEDVYADAESVSTGYCDTCAGHGLEVSIRVDRAFREQPPTPDCKQD